MEIKPNEIIQAYFFDKITFSEKDVIAFLIKNNLPTSQNISDGKYYYKIKLYSEKKLKLEGYNIIQKYYEQGIKINLATKPPLLNNYVKFS
jgi:hypothetical protein